MSDKTAAARELKRLLEQNGAIQVDAGAEYGYVTERGVLDVAAWLEARESSPYRPQLQGSDMLSHDRVGDVTINVPTALCWLQFRPGACTGTDDDTRPGVGFSLVAYPGTDGRWPSGVVPRGEAVKLHAMLTKFLEDTK